jgi:hypothetical protein
VNEQIADYIQQNRDRYTREAITDQLIKAGHNPSAIEEAWAMSNAALEAAADARPRYGRFTLALLAIGGLATFVIWSGLYSTGGGGLATLSYLITGLVAIGIGIALTRAASGGAWVVVLALAVLSTFGLLWVALANSAYGYGAVAFLAPAIAALAAVSVIAVHRYQVQVPYLAYALPVLGWLTVTGICMSPLLTGV